LVSNAVGTVTSSNAFLTVLPKGSAILAESLMLTNGKFSFQATSPAGQNWSVQASTNLADWGDVAVLTNATGTMMFNRPATNFTREFYRLRLAP
jgi:hypothetical protein